MKRLMSRLFLLLFLGLALESQAAHDRGGDGVPRNNRYMPSTDPNLDPNWDWTVSGPGHTLYFTDSLGIVRSTVRQLPFFTAGHPLNTLEKDMYPQDGWVLAYRDFGTPTAAPDLPFFVLYNKYRGIFRVMMFNTREVQYSRFNLELSFKSPAAAGAIFTFTDPTRAFLTDYDSTRVQSFMAEANAFNGWIYGDFMITGYDPNLNPNTQLRLHIKGMDVSAVQLDSTQFSLSEVLSDANPGTGKSTSASLVDAANQGQKYYKTVEGAAKSLRETAAKDTSNSWWKPIVQRLLGTPSLPSAVSSVAPVVGALMGFVGAFIGGQDDPAPREPLNFQGALKMTGSISQSVPLYSLDFGLKYTPGDNPPDFYRPLRPITWGLFNLTSQPLVYSRSKIQACVGILICPGTNIIYAEGYLKSIPTYQFNPDAGLDLISVRYALTFPSRAPGSFSGNAFFYEETAADRLPNGVAVEVRMRTKSPTLYFDNDIVFYKVYPITTTPEP